MSYKQTVEKLSQIVSDYDGKHSTFAVSIEHSKGGNANTSIAGDELNIIKAICHAINRDKRVENIIMQAVNIHRAIGFLKDIPE
jgi:hypothetical protein